MTRWTAVAVLMVCATGCSCDDKITNLCADGQVCVIAGDASSRSDGEGENDGAAGDTGLCSGTLIPIDYRAPNVLLIFDRSCSMRRELVASDMFGEGPEDPLTRWNVAREAVRTITERFNTRIFWGLMTFPDPTEGCGDRVGTEVLPGPNQSATIIAELQKENIQPFGLCGPDNSDQSKQPRQTPTYDALLDARDLPELNTNDRPNFAIVVTDGGVSCGVSDTQLTTLTEELVSFGIRVGVIGFSTGAEVSNLDAIAAVGGLVNTSGPATYYVADDPSSLDAVLNEIARRVVSCEFALGTTPMDPANLTVLANGDPLGRDDPDGWSYDTASNTVALAGAACERLRNGDITSLRVGSGCVDLECEPSTEVCNGLDDDCDERVDEGCIR